MSNKYIEKLSKMISSFKIDTEYVVIKPNGVDDVKECLGIFDKVILNLIN